MATTTTDATQTVLSNQPTATEGEKEKLNEEVKLTEQEKLTEEQPASVTDLTDTVDKPDDKPVIVPITEEVLKTEYKPVVDIPLKENMEVSQDSVQEPEKPFVPVAITTEQPNIVDVPISSSEVTDKTDETSEVSLVKEPKAVTVKEIEVTETECSKEETPEPAIPVVKGKNDVAEEKIEWRVPKVEEELLEPEPAVAVVEKEREPEPATGVVENKPEPVAVVVEEKRELAGEEKAEVVVSKVEEKPETAVPVIEDEQEEPVTPEVEVKSKEIAPVLMKEGERALPEVEKVEPADNVKVEEIPAETHKPAVPEVGDKPVAAALEIEEKTTPVLPIVEEKPEPVVPVKDKTVEQPIIAGEAEKCEKIESNGPASGETEKVEVLAPEPIKDDSAVSTPEVAPSAEEDTKTRDVELVTENEENKSGKENEDPTPVEFEKDKTDELPKEELPAKPKSTNILTKVKKSIVKAKKAILGKSPSSKTIITTPTKTKGDTVVSEVIKE